MTTSPSRTMLEQLVAHVFRDGAIAKESPGTVVVYAPMLDPVLASSGFKHMAPIITIHHENADVAALAAVRAIGEARGRLDPPVAGDGFQQTAEALNTVGDGLLHLVQMYEAGAPRSAFMGMVHDMIGQLRAQASRAKIEKKT